MQQSRTNQLMYIHSSTHYTAVDTPISTLKWNTNYNTLCECIPLFAKPRHYPSTKHSYSFLRISKPNIPRMSEARDGVEMYTAYPSNGLNTHKHTQFAVQHCVWWCGFDKGEVVYIHVHTCTVSLHEHLY